MTKFLLLPLQDHFLATRYYVEIERSHSTLKSKHSLTQMQLGLKKDLYGSTHVLGLLLFEISYTLILTRLQQFM